MTRVDIARVSKKLVAHHACKCGPNTLLDKLTRGKPTRSRMQSSRLSNCRELMLALAKKWYHCSNQWLSYQGIITESDEQSMGIFSQSRIAMSLRTQEGLGRKFEQKGRSCEARKPHRSNTRQRWHPKWPLSKSGHMSEDPSKVFIPTIIVSAVAGYCLGRYYYSILLLDLTMEVS